MKVTIFTRPSENNNFAGYTEFFGQMKNEGIDIRTKPNIHQKFAIIDQKVVWYGSINLLSFGQSEESMMRLVNSNIAYELMKSLKDINEKE